MTGNIVHVVGTGTIGEPLVGILADLRTELGIDEVTFAKRTPLLEDRLKVFSLMKRGANLAAEKSRWSSFRELGMDPTYDSEEAIGRASVVIDCTPDGNGSLTRRSSTRSIRVMLRHFWLKGLSLGLANHMLTELMTRHFKMEISLFKL